MNPYDFVRIDWNHPPVRRAYTPQNRFDGLSGEVTGVITTETPLFIPQARARGGGGAKQFVTNAHGEKIIPGSSLKGLIRSLVETIGPGCWRLFDGRYRDNTDYTRKLPSAFASCNDLKSLCPACRMFGLIQGNALLAGNVGFEDALCNHSVPHQAIYTPILDAPKPRHEAWYLTTDKSRLAGRKFYFHAKSINTSPKVRVSKSGVQLNQYIQPVGVGTSFTFSAHFTNLAADDLSLLLYALTLETTIETNMRHKIGYAKPAGLGSVRIELTELMLVDYKQRYTAGAGGKTVHVDIALKNFVAQQVQHFTSNQQSNTLNDLRRIWQWPPQHEIAYPDQQWFEKNPQTPISKT